MLPRLYRDSIVYESWEGTHNVLVAQVLADLHRMPIVDVVGERVGKVLTRKHLTGRPSEHTPNSTTRSATCADRSPTPTSAPATSAASSIAS